MKTYEPAALAVRLAAVVAYVHAFLFGGAAFVSLLAAGYEWTRFLGRPMHMTMLSLAAAVPAVVLVVVGRIFWRDAEELVIGSDGPVETTAGRRAMLLAAAIYAFGSLCVSDAIRNVFSEWFLCDQFEWTFQQWLASPLTQERLVLYGFDLAVTFTCLVAGRRIARLVVSAMPRRENAAG